MIRWCARRGAAAHAQAKHEPAEDDHGDVLRAGAQRRADHEHHARQDQHALRVPCSPTLMRPVLWLVHSEQ